VKAIQSCIDFSVNNDLVKFEKPFNMRDWEIVPYVEGIPRQENR